MTKKERIVRYSSENIPKDTLTDWDRVHAMTDEDIEQAIADDPDAAPVLTEDFFRTAELVRTSSGKKRRITILVDDEIIDYFQKEGKAGYQKRMHDVLKAYVRHDNVRHA